METSRVLAAPGVRTRARPGWSAGLGVALSWVVDRPSLWLFGILGFSLRGGIVLLTLPIIVLPTPVEVRLLLGDYLGTSGFSQRFWTESGVVALVAATSTVVVLLVLARIEIAAFVRLPFVDEGSAHRIARSALVPVLGVQFIAFLGVLLAAAPVARSAIQASYAEIVRPSSAAPIYDRVVGLLGLELLLFAAAIVVIEMASALATREILARSLRATGAAASEPLLLLRSLGSAIGRLARSPIRIVATALFGWLVTAALLAVGLAVVVLAWAGTRSVFLTSVSLADLGDNLGMLLMAVALSAAFTVAVALGGFASALRAATWSVDRLR
jgi:hypothetical protein